MEKKREKQMEQTRNTKRWSGWVGVLGGGRRGGGEEGAVLGRGCVCGRDGGRGKRVGERSGVWWRGGGERREEGRGVWERREGGFRGRKGRVRGKEVKEGEGGKEREGKREGKKEEKRDGKKEGKKGREK